MDRGNCWCARGDQNAQAGPEGLLFGDRVLTRLAEVPRPQQRLFHRISSTLGVQLGPHPICAVVASRPVTPELERWPRGRSARTLPDEFLEGGASRDRAIRGRGAPGEDYLRAMDIAEYYNIDYVRAAFRGTVDDHGVPAPEFPAIREEAAAAERRPLGDGRGLPDSLCPAARTSVIALVGVSPVSKLGEWPA
jgi:hypothetical protein